MKKVLLFVIIALSISAFAQNKRPAHHMLQVTPNSSENVLSWIEAAALKTPEILSKINLLHAFQHQSFIQGSFFQKNDSIYNWQWDTPSGGWKVTFKYIDIVYDGNNVMSELGKKWTGSAWVDSLQNAYTYNAANYPTSILSKYWDGSTWANSDQATFTYDANNNNTSMVMKYWDGSVWANLMKLTFTYDANNNNTSLFWQFGNGTDWDNFSQSTYTYDANNNQLSGLDQTWNVDSWDNTSKSTWTYDASNKKTSGLEQMWNVTVWEDYVKTTYTYNASNNLTIELQQMWMGTEWFDMGKITYTYDANNNLINELHSGFNFISWYNTEQYIYTYDVNNFVKGESSKFWGFGGGEILSGDSTHYYYHAEVTGIPGLMNANINVFPNPGTGKVTINSNNAISAIEIYNLSGKRIYSDFNAKQQNSKDIDLTGYAKGIYIIKIYNGTKFYNRKVVVQ